MSAQTSDAQASRCKLRVGWRAWQSPSLYASLALLTVTIFFWDGVDLLTPFIFPLVATVTWAVFALVFVGSVHKSVRSDSGSRIYKFRLVLLNLAIGMICFFVPLAEWKNYFDFHLNLPRRTQVVELAVRNELSRPYEYNKQICALPWWLRDLSKGGGDVIVTDANQSETKPDPSTLHVFFYTYRGVLERHSGFEYSADDKPPRDESEAKEVIHLRQNWYWVAY